MKPKTDVPKDLFVTTVCQIISRELEDPMMPQFRPMLTMVECILKRNASVSDVLIRDFNAEHLVESFDEDVDHLVVKKKGHWFLVTFFRKTDEEMEKFGAIRRSFVRVSRWLKRKFRVQPYYFIVEDQPLADLREVIACLPPRDLTEYKKAFETFVDDFYQRIIKIYEGIWELKKQNGEYLNFD
jgi:hypothetical protein